ncbi:hypothetical protein L195_g050694, partial [Trifolium pratense]
GHKEALLHGAWNEKGDDKLVTEKEYSELRIKTSKQDKEETKMNETFDMVIVLIKLCLGTID